MAHLQAVIQSFFKLLPFKYINIVMQQTTADRVGPILIACHPIIREIIPYDQRIEGEKDLQTKHSYSKDRNCCLPTVGYNRLHHFKQ